MTGVYGTLREMLGDLAKAHGYDNEPVEVVARTLTPQEAIGNPEDDDYPILKGKERMMAAILRGAEGHAFTDMFGNYSGTVNDVIHMELGNNFRRAVFIATLNAVTRSLGIAERTVHCRGADPRDCAALLVEKIGSFDSPGRVVLIGLQPRMLEALAGAYEVRVTDMDTDNIGRVKYGVRIEGPDATPECCDWCDLALVTGTTVVNGTIEKFLNLGKTTVFYGVSISGACALLNLNRFCPLGR